MNMGKKITELREGTKIPRESRYVVEMGDGTGTKQVKHHNLVAQLLEDMSLGYDETMEFLNGTGIAEGNEALRAFRDWLVSRVVNNLMTTEAGFFLDGRAGKTLADGLAEINSNLGGFSVKSAMGAEIRDANAAEMGIYHIGERMPNSAFNFWSTIIATSFRNGWTQQICFPWSSNEKRIAYRLKNADGWQSWHYINFDN